MTTLEDWQRAKPAVDAWQEAHPFDSIEVEPIGEGIYRIHSSYDKESIATTKRGLLSLLAWLTEHQEELQRPASPSR